MQSTTPPVLRLEATSRLPNRTYNTNKENFVETITWSATP
jgi:hypothetical protein